MEYRYFITEDKKKEWKKEKFGDEYEKLLLNFLNCNVDIKQAPGKASLLQDDFWLTKHTGKHSRPTFVWQRKVINEDVCFYVYRTAYRHDKYSAEITQGNKDSYIAKNQLTEKEEVELDNCYKSIVESRKVKKQETLATLSPNELAFISSMLPINHSLFKDPIYETREWVEDITNEDDVNEAFDEFSMAAQKIEEYILDNINGVDGWGQLSAKDRIILIYHRGTDWILAAAPLKDDKTKINKIINGECPTDFLRGYPFTFLSSEDEWRRMEKESKSNLVLTEEQVQVVATNAPNYPLFISGRAGSGKSTVLQYLFAEVVLRYLSVKKDGDNSRLLSPVYLSYSETLIEDAKKLSSVLFDKNSVYKDALNKIKLDYKKDIAPQMGDMFYVFKTLLKNCIEKYQPEILKSRFSESNYISFAVFKRKWMEKFGKDREALRKYGPSISWHVIRTYIKGWNSEKITTPEDYAKLGRNYLTVRRETFELVYNNVWEKWYKELTEETGWDDQDLVKFCLEHKYVDEQFSAIYCDEAQDFTRIEIDFILKISSFSNRQIDVVDDVKKLPFVFAGDEFQTLNPTGFSWDSLRGYFVERLFNKVGLEGKNDESNLPRPIEFNENFRSTSQIVQLANRIQLLRATRLGEYSKPQVPHFAVDGPSIFCISPKENLSIWDSMKGGKNLVNMIVPVAEGESVEDYIKSSPLKDRINFVDGIPEGLTILTPSQAKGCEYSNVILYGFSLKDENSEFSVSNLLNWFDNPQINLENDIELKYQICNAYVAVTRAISRLYILDEFNMDSFWAFAFNDSNEKNRINISKLQEKMLSCLKAKRKEWEDERLLGWINEPPTEGFAYFDEMKSKDIREELERLKANAEMREDAPFMRMVACRYKERGLNEESKECLAKAFVFEGKFMDAADNFVLAKQYKEALDTYWKELGLSDTPIGVIRKISQLKGHVEDLRLTRCCDISDSFTLRSFKNLLADCLSYIRNNAKQDNSPWQVLINYSLTKVKSGNINADSDELRTAIKLSEELAGYSINIDSFKLAYIAKECGNDNAAIKLWENCGQELPSDYFALKYKNTKYPQNIEFAPKSNNPNWCSDVIADYRKHKDATLSELQKSIICNAISFKRDYSDVIIDFLPYQLRKVQSLEVLISLLDEAYNIGAIAKENGEPVELLFEVKNGNAQSLQVPSGTFAKETTLLFYKAINEIKKIRTKEFKNHVNRKFDHETVHMSEFLAPWKQFANTPLVTLVLIEVGKILEHREKKVDAIRFYEYAKNLSNDTEFRKELDKRWIYSKEKLAEITNMEQPAKDAYEKRKLLQIENVAIPDKPSLTDSQWEKLFKMALELDMSLLPAKILSDVKNIAPTKEVDVLQQPILKLSEKKQVISYGENYEITYFPQKSEVKLEYNTENDSFMAKFKSGKLTGSSEFVIKENRLYTEETDMKTPFVIRKDDKYLWIDVYDDDVPTGISIATLL